MKRFSSFIFCFLISNTLVFSGFSKESFSFDEGVKGLEKVDQASISDSQRKSIDKIERQYDRKIKKAKRKNKSLDQALLDLEIKLEETYLRTLKAKRELSKPKNMNKVLKKFKRQKKEMSQEKIIGKMNTLTDRKAFEDSKKQALEKMKELGSEVKFLEYVKEQLMSEAKLAMESSKKGSRAIASDTLNFLKWLVLAGLSIYGIIALVGIASVFSIIGAVIILPFALLFTRNTLWYIINR